MKKLSYLFFAFFFLFSMISCGGSDNSTETETENGVSVSLKGATLTDISAMSVEIFDLTGTTVFTKSFQGNELRAAMSISGIKPVKHATLIIKCYSHDDVNNAKWFGRATGLDFNNGVTTSVDITLYPTSKQSKEFYFSDLGTGRFGHTNKLLPDGRILVAGGFSSCSQTGKCSASKSVEIIDLETGTSETLKDLTYPRGMHSAIALKDGSVLFIGGFESFGTNLQETAFDGYPQLPYTMTKHVAVIEKYMPSYPSHNKQKNGFGTIVENVSLPQTNMTLPFKDFQTVLVQELSNEDIITSINNNSLRQTVVFLAGGIDENETPSNKIYKFTINDGNDLSISEAVELPENSDPMILPTLIYDKENDLLIAAGGRPAAAESYVSQINDSANENWEGKENNNIFFTKAVLVNGSMYTFSGYNLNPENTLEPLSYMNLKDKTVKNISGTLRIKNSEQIILFPEIIADTKNYHFLILGGLNAEDAYQVVDMVTLENYGELYHTMPDSRIMPNSIIVPAEFTGNKPLLIITGGISTLSSVASGNQKIEANIF